MNTNKYNKDSNIKENKNLIFCILSFGYNTILFGWK